MRRVADVRATPGHRQPSARRTSVGGRRRASAAAVDAQRAPVPCGARASRALDRASVASSARRRPRASSSVRSRTCGPATTDPVVDLAGRPRDRRPGWRRAGRGGGRWTASASVLLNGRRDASSNAPASSAPRRSLPLAAAAVRGCGSRSRRRCGSTGAAGWCCRCAARPAGRCAPGASRSPPRRRSSPSGARRRVVRSARSATASRRGAARARHPRRAPEPVAAAAPRPLRMVARRRRRTAARVAQDVHGSAAAAQVPTGASLACGVHDRRRSRARPGGLLRAVRPAADARPARGGRPARGRAGRRRARVPRLPRGPRASSISRSRPSSSC